MAHTEILWLKYKTHLYTCQLGAHCSLFSSLSPGELPSLDSYVKGPFYSHVLLYDSHCYFPLAALMAQCVLYTHSLHLSAGPKKQHGRNQVCSRCVHWLKRSLQTWACAPKAGGFLCSRAKEFLGQGLVPNTSVCRCEWVQQAQMWTPKAAGARMGRERECDLPSCWTVQLYPLTQPCGTVPWEHRPRGSHSPAWEQHQTSPFISAVSPFFSLPQTAPCKDV